MNKIVLGLGLLLIASPVLAKKSCDELKAEIAAKMDTHKVVGAQLDIVAKDEVKNQHVVGSCDGGSKRITYSKGAAAKSVLTPPAPAAAAPG